MFKKSIPFIFVLLWSTGFIGTKYGLFYASTGDFLTVRTLANVLIFFCLILFLKQPKLTLQQIVHAMVTGLLIHGAYLGGVYGAIEFGVSAGLTAIIVGLQPLLTSVIAIVIFKNSLSKMQWLALFIGFIGLILVVSAGLEVATISLTAITYAFIALIGITFGTLYQKRFCQNQALLPSVAWQYVASLLIFIPLSLTDNGQTIQWTVEFILSLAWLVVVLSVIAILLLMYMVEQGDSAKVSSYFYLVPPVTVLFSWLLFDETLALTSFIGMCLCVLSVYFVVKPENKSE